MGAGMVLTAAQFLLVPLALSIFAGGGALDVAAHDYVTARFLGAPAALAVYAVTGWLLGLGRTQDALRLQIVMNGVNVALDILFVWHFDLGARGVGLGTAVAEWSALFTGLAIAARALGPGAAAGLAAVRKRLFERSAMRRLFAVNADIMVRTIALLALFAWFANAGARLGTVQLAANHVLMQFVSVAAFVLDGFAFTAESRVGQAIGRGSRTELRRAIRLTGEFSVAAGFVFAAGTLMIGQPLINLITDHPAVRAAAGALLPFAAAVPLIGVPAWLLDGIFIGATRGRALRNAAVVATLCYIATDWLLRPLGATGVWVALLASYGYRAIALGAFLPGLLAEASARP